MYHGSKFFFRVGYHDWLQVHVNSVFWGAADVDLFWAAQVLFLTLAGQWPTSECPRQAVLLVSSCGTRAVGVPCRMRGICASGCSFVSCKCQGRGITSSNEGRTVLQSSCSLESWGLLFLGPFSFFIGFTSAAWRELSVGMVGVQCLSCIVFLYPCCRCCFLV